MTAPSVSWVAAAVVEARVAEARVEATAEARVAGWRRLEKAGVVARAEAMAAGGVGSGAEGGSEGGSGQGWRRRA